jgi:hypothetical protein
MTIPLHVPELMRLLAAGDQLTLFDEELSRRDPVR